MNKITFAVIAATAVGAAGLVLGEPHGTGFDHGHGPGGNPLEHVAKELNLTPDQQAKVAPIIEGATPQIRAIHQEAMQKMHAVMQNTADQIRPLLTPEQQAKLDAIRKAHEDMLKAHQELEAATKS